MAQKPKKLKAGRVIKRFKASLKRTRGKNLMSTQIKTQAPFRVGQWLPSDHTILKHWLDNLITEVKEQHPPHVKKRAMLLGKEKIGEEEVINWKSILMERIKNKTIHPVIREFNNFIESNPEVFLLFNQMFTQVPKKPPYDKDPTGRPQVPNYHAMLVLLDQNMTKAPQYERDGLVGFPINAILDWSMGTVSGYAAFLNEKVNTQFKRVLNEWAKFLDSSDSAYVLGDDPKTGWFGKDAMEDMPNFVDNFVCDPKKTHYGFKSWDDFFTRQFREGRRPISSPNDDAVIVNACESAPFRLATKVQKHDDFWIKGQPYSLQDMLANDEHVDEFVGGTIYQAFLSALSYHRWHSPVSGTVVKTRNIEGTYYAELLDEGFYAPPDISWNSPDGDKMVGVYIKSHGPDPYAPNNSQAYITEVAARALIFIKADNPAIGLMCFVAVGMAEVSSCQITVKAGQHIKKGEQLGMFHFGGSTHCLIFRPSFTVSPASRLFILYKRSNLIPYNWLTA
jgi:phosphatidylserine decarboxylase